MTYNIENVCNRTACFTDPAHHHIPDSNFGAESAHAGEFANCPTPRCEEIRASLKYDADPAQADLIAKVAEISEWWVKTAQRDAEKTAPKSVEYGAVDFDFMGQFMVALVADKFAGADDAELMKVGREMAVLFYLVGKIGRQIGAYQQGIMPSDDTLLDTSVYAMMMRRIRETGRWT